jgi:hypothetical protein
MVCVLAHELQKTVPPPFVPVRLPPPVPVRLPPPVSPPPEDAGESFLHLK